MTYCTNNVRVHDPTQICTISLYGKVVVHINNVHAVLYSIIVLHMCIGCTIAVVNGASIIDGHYQLGEV